MKNKNVNYSPEDFAKISFAVANIEHAQKSRAIFETYKEIAAARYGGDLGREHLENFGLAAVFIAGIITGKREAREAASVKNDIVE